MIIRASDGIRGLLVDLQTNQPILMPVWANLETGEYEALKADGNGQPIGPPGKELRIKGKTQLKFIPAKSVDVKIGEPEPVAKPKIHRRPEPIKVPLFSRYCQHYGCNRIAAWMVSEEEELPPLRKGRRLLKQAKLLRVCYFCSFHYVGPKLFDHRGELIEIDHEAGGVRPQ